MCLLSKDIDVRSLQDYFSNRAFSWVTRRALYTRLSFKSFFCYFKGIVCWYGLALPRQRCSRLLLFLGPLGPLALALSVCLSVCLYVILIDSDTLKHSFKHIKHNNNTLLLQHSSTTAH